MQFYKNFKKFISNKGSYFNRILSFFLLFLLPIMIASVITFFYMRNNITENINKYNTSVVDSTVTQLENEFKELRQLFHLATHSKSSIDILSNINSKTGTFEIELVKLNKVLAETFSIKSNISNWFVYFKNRNILLAQDGIYNADQYLGFYSSYEKYDTKFWSSSLLLNESLRVLGTTKVNKNTISALSPNYFEYEIPVSAIFQKTSDSEIILNINLREEYFYNLIKLYTTTKGNHIFILDHEGKLISHTDRSLFEKESYSDISSIKELENGSVYGQKITHNKSDYILYARKLEFPQWTICSLVPTNEFYENQNFILQILLFINAFTFLTGLAFAYLFSSRLYSPINNLVNLLHPGNEEAHPNLQLNEIDLIKDRLNFLKKSTDDLSLTLVMVKPLALERVIHNLIFSDSTTIDEKEIIQLFSGDKIKLNRKFFITVVFKILYTDVFQKEYAEDAQYNLKQKVYDLVKGVIQHTYADSIFVEFGNGNYYVVINDDDNDFKNNLKFTLKGICDILKYDSNYISFFSVLGKTVESLTNLSSSYRSASELMEYIHAEDASCVLDSEKVDFKNLVYFPSNFDEILTSAIIEKNEINLEALYTDILSKNLLDGELIFKSNRLSELVLRAYSKILQSFNMDLRILEKHMDDTKKNQHDLEALVKIFISIHEDLLERLNGTPNQKKMELENYIASNYQYEATCLEKMADDLNLNSNYLSRMFKEHVGDTFSDYLSKSRVEKAKELLITTEFTVEEIGNLVGIPNKGTFGRNFKKNTGISPGTYRVIRR